MTGALLFGGAGELYGAYKFNQLLNSGANNAANTARLSQQLTRQEAESIFNSSGGLKPGVIWNSKVIIKGNELKDSNVIKALTSNGSSISDWAKMSTEAFKSPSGLFQVYYYNLATGEVSNYGMKAVFGQ
jgi:hypothetical protein